jgi:hypothetical protein
LSDEDAAAVPAAAKPAAAGMKVTVPEHAANSSGGGSWLSENDEAAAAGHVGDADNTGEEASSAKSDSKPSTPTEKARALARAALGALSPQLRKSREWRSGRYAAPSSNSSSTDGSSSSKKKGWKKAEKKGEKKVAAAAVAVEEKREIEAVAASSVKDPAAAEEAEAAEAPVKAAEAPVKTAAAAADATDAADTVEGPVKVAAPGASVAAEQEDAGKGSVAAAAAAEEEAAAHPAAEVPAKEPATATATALCSQVPQSADTQMAGETAAADAAGQQRRAQEPEPLHVSLEAIASSASVEIAAAAAAAAGPAALPESCAAEAEIVSCFRYEQEADEAAAKILEQAARSRPCSLVGARASFNSRRTSSSGLAAGKDGPLCHLASSCDMGSVDAEYAMASAEAAMAAAAAVAALPVGSRSRLASFGVSQDAIINSVASGGLASTGSITAMNSSSFSGAAAAAAASNSSSSTMSGGVGAGRLSAGGRSGSGGSSSSGDYRYSELIFRLQQFLPALKAADGSGAVGDFESTWELIKVCESSMEGQQQQQQGSGVHGPVSQPSPSSQALPTSCSALAVEGAAAAQAPPAAGGSCGEPMPPSSVVNHECMVPACT